MCMIYLCFSHEIVGIVEKVGSEVKRFRVGDPVGVGTYVNSCRACEYCNDGLEVHCVKGSVFTFNGIDADGTVTKGGYSSYFVAHERQVLSADKLQTIIYIFSHLLVFPVFFLLSFFFFF